MLCGEQGILARDLRNFLVTIKPSVRWVSVGSLHGAKTAGNFLVAVMSRTAQGPTHSIRCVIIEGDFTGAKAAGIFLFATIPITTFAFPLPDCYCMGTGIFAGVKTAGARS
jgi:hypothetical protein